MTYPDSLELLQGKTLDGDFNGDSKIDFASLVKNKNNHKVGVMILHQSENQDYFVFGAGKEVNGMTDLNWIEIFELIPKGETVAPELVDEKTGVKFDPINLDQGTFGDFTNAKKQIVYYKFSALRMKNRCLEAQPISIDDIKKGDGNFGQNLDVNKETSETFDPDNPTKYIAVKRQNNFRWFDKWKLPTVNSGTVVFYAIAHRDIYIGFHSDAKADKKSKTQNANVKMAKNNKKPAVIIA